MWRLALLLVACSEPHYHSGQLHCAASGRACPDDFYCGAGGLCWQNGSGPDLAPAGVDLAGVDLAGLDFSGVDFSLPPDLAQPIDLAGVDAASPSLCPGSFKICDGFEAVSLNARWTSENNSGSVMLDTSRSYRGSSSLHLHTEPVATAGFDPFANLVTYSMLPLSGMAYARAWVFLPSSYPGDFNQILNFSDDSGHGTSFATQDGFPIMNDYSTPLSFSQSTTVTIPKNRWVCLSLQVSQSGTTGALKLFIDDAEVADTSFASAATPTMSHIYLGLDWVGNSANFPATDIWMDEIVIHNQPVSCSE